MTEAKDSSPTSPQAVVDEGGNAQSRELVGAENPYNWSKGRKWLLTVIYCFNNFTTSMGSSLFTPGIFFIAAEFKQSVTVTTLGLSFYVLGFVLGPAVFAPMSEVYGRKAVQAPAWLFFTLFQLGCALAPNIETLVICRLLVGIFGSPALTVAGGVVADFFAANEMGPPLGLFTMAAFLGPVAGPIVGGFLVQELPADKGWRWCFWVQFILSGALGLNWLWMPETFGKLLVEKKAKRLGLKMTNVEKTPKGKLFKTAIWRPLQMLVLDPIVYLASLYISLIFGILYLFFAAYPIVFQGRYHMKPGPSGLAFLGIGVGVIISFLTAGYANTIYVRLKTARGLENAPFPEGRLPPAILGAFFVPGSLFWFAWTGKKSIHWIVPILSGVPFGWSMSSIFISLVTFIAEGYLTYAASAIAASTMLRSAFAAAFPLFSMHMYNKLTPEWASSLLGFAALAFVPVPYLFWIHGPKLRARSRFQPELGGEAEVEVEVEVEVEAEDTKEVEGEKAPASGESSASASVTNA